MRRLNRYRVLALAWVTAAAIAILAILPGPAIAGIVIGKAYPDGPAIILAPPEESTVADAPAEPPPLPRAKPERKKASDPKPKKPAAKKVEQKKAPAKKAEQKKAPANAQAAPAQESKTCDYCYGCQSAGPDCRRKWTCGKRYREVVVLGLCRR